MNRLKEVVDRFSLDLSKQQLLLVELDSFSLTLFGDEEPITYRCSSASKGIGNKEGSEQTPTGLHQITEKIGDNKPEGAIFKSRQWTGEIWNEEMPPAENMILSRILRLRGLEEGVNSGGDVDSYNRYIYIHGTNQEGDVGRRNISHGCIVLTNKQIITLFNSVSEGDYVYIS